MVPQLSAPLGPRFAKFPCFVQPKLNGVRALWQSFVMQSRGEKLWKLPFYQHLNEELQTVAHLLKRTMLDGEIYRHGWRLQRINSAFGVNNNAPNADTKDLEFHIFDAIDERGFRAPFSERFLDLRTIIASAQLPHIKVVHTAFVHSRDEMNRYFHAYVEDGYEGLMARPDGPYVVGETPHGTRKNSPHLWKLKAWKDGEYRCIGVTPGEGKAAIGIGALILVAPKPNEALESSMFNVGTGFTDEDRISLAANPPIGKLIRVRYVETTSDGIPYPCRFEAVMGE